jgi:hypothetical protein
VVLAVVLVVVLVTIAAAALTLSREITSFSFQLLALSTRLTAPEFDGHHWSVLQAHLAVVLSLGPVLQ